MKALKILFLLSLAVTLGCEKEKESEKEEKCGCNSPNLTSSLIEGREIEAIIYYTKEENSVYQNSFWIIEGFNRYIVCNENILPEAVKKLKTNNENGIKIKCKGHSKEVCESPIDIANVTYSHILITKIELL